MPDSAFDAWYNEIEGFALRAERLTGPRDELMAAFEAGAVAAWDRATAAERERCAKVAEDRAAAGFADLPESGDAYLQWSISSATIIAAAIRNPPEQPA